MLLVLLVQVVKAEVEMYPGAMAITGDYVWACFPPTQGRDFPICAKVHKNKFCPTVIENTGVFRCYKPMIAEDG